MRSIRLSLVVYFLLLSGTALGAVSLFVYESSHQALRESEKSKKDLLEAQFRARAKEADAALERRVLSRAQTLARFTRWSIEHYESLFPLGILCAGMQPQGHLTIPLWMWEAYHFDLAGEVRRQLPRDISIESVEEVAPSAEEAHGTEYYQI